MGLGKEENKDSESRKGQKYFLIYNFFILKINFRIPEFKDNKFMNWCNLCGSGHVTDICTIAYFLNTLNYQRKELFYMFHTLLVINGPKLKQIIEFFIEVFPGFYQINENLAALVKKCYIFLNELTFEFFTWKSTEDLTKNFDSSLRLSGKNGLAKARFSPYSRGPQRTNQTAPNPQSEPASRRSLGTDLTFLYRDIN